MLRAIVVAIIIQAGGQDLLVADGAQLIDAGGFDAASGLGRHVAAHLAKPHQEQHAIELLAEHGGIGD